MVVKEDSPPPAAARLLGRARTLLIEAARRFRVRRETGPLDTVEALARFAHTRAAFVAQKKLYGYLKARMGMTYPHMFKDDVFVASINLAKWHVFAACLSDILVHVSARLVAIGALEPHEAEALARHCHEAGLAANEGECEPGMREGWRSAFHARLARVNWQNIGVSDDCFTESPAALYRWAPIEESLKGHDREIVENSIRFAWAEIACDFRTRAVPAAIAADFRRMETA